MKRTTVQKETTMNAEHTTWYSFRIYATCLLVIMFTLSGCNARKGRQALREGTVAELQGDWELARHKYAEACTLENGEAFRKLVDLSLRKDTESLLTDDIKDEEWSKTAHELTQRISRIGHEAARRGYPVEDLDAKLAAFDAAIETSLEEAREAERAAREAERLAEERRREAERLAEERRKAEQARSALQAEANTIERQIREIEREMEDCDRDFKEVEERADAEKGAIEMYLLENRRYFSGNDAYRMGQELALKYKPEMDRIKIHKKRLESELPDLQRQLEAVRQKLAATVLPTASEALDEDATHRRGALIQSIFSDMGGDTLVEASERVVQAQQDTLRQVTGGISDSSLLSGGEPLWSQDDIAADLARLRAQREAEEEQERARLARQEAERRAQRDREEEAARKDLETAQSALADKN